MKTKAITLLGAIGLVLASQSGLVYAEKERRGPPPGAFTACEGKSEGDTAQFENKRGETVSGTCEKSRGGKLVLRPEGKKSKGKREKP